MRCRMPPRPEVGRIPNVRENKRTVKSAIQKLGMERPTNENILTPWLIHFLGLVAAKIPPLKPISREIDMATETSSKVAGKRFRSISETGAP